MLLLGLVFILSLLGASSVFAETNNAIVHPSKLVDTAIPVVGQGQYGRYGLEVTKGQVHIILDEQQADYSWKKVHEFTLYTPSGPLAHYYDYWMKNGTRYTITLIAVRDTELGVGYVRN